MSIIDSHSHYFPNSIAQKTAFFKAGWSDINRQLSVMDENRIAKSLLLYPTSDAHIMMGGWDKLCDVYNEEISKVVKLHPDRFIGAGILPIDQPQKIKPELKRIKDLDLKVISMASSYDRRYLDEEMFFDVYEFSENNRMPIHVHPQIMDPIGGDRVRDPLLTPVLEYVFDVSVCIGKMMMSGTFLKYPDVKFIFAHYGGALPLVKERFDNTYTMLRKREFVKDISKLPSDYFKNLYFDTSGSKSVATLLCSLELVDDSHILFGTDFPANQNVPQSIIFLQNTSIFRDSKEKILGANLLNLL